MKHGGLAAALAALTTVAWAQPAAADAPIETDIHAYYAGEERAGYWLLGAGAIAAGASVGLYLHGSRFSRGMSYTLGGVGLIQLVAGTVFALGADGKEAVAKRRLAEDAAVFRQGEIATMNRFHKQFVAVEILELACVAGGAVMVGMGVRNESRLLLGLGVGLALQGAFMFGIDHAWDGRVVAYRSSLERFQVAVGPAGLDGGLAFSVGGQF